MDGLGLSGIFITYPKGFVCGNEGSIDVESDVVKDLSGVRSGVKRTKTLKVKNVFIHGESPVKDQQVVCLTRLNTGNVFRYDGFISFITDDGIVSVTLSGKAEKEGIQEIINSIVSL
jgi:hypothetical protein